MAPARNTILLMVISLILILGATGLAGCIAKQPVPGGPQVTATTSGAGPGRLPAVGPVTYTTQDNVTLTLPYAYPGLVTLLVKQSTSRATIETAAATLGATIEGEVPESGIYILKVPQGREAEVISALFRQEFTVDAAPATPFTTGAEAAQVVVVDTFEVFSDSECEPHGDHTAWVAGGWSSSAKQVPINTPEFEEAIAPLPGLPKVTGTWYPTLGRTIKNEMKAGTANGTRTTISLSLQSVASYYADDKIPQLCSNPKTAASLDCRVIQQEQLIFLEQIFQTLQYSDKKLRDNTAIAVIAGNAGVDLTEQIKKLQSLYPQAARSIRIVGGTDQDGNIFKGFNYASSGMVYARSIDVPTYPGIRCKGTSFAGPQIANTINEIWQAAPGLTSDQVTSVLDDSLASCSGASSSKNILPHDESGKIPDVFLHCVTEKAKEKGGLLPTTAPTTTAGPDTRLTIVMTGDLSAEDLEGTTIGWSTEPREQSCSPTSGGAQCNLKFPYGTTVEVSVFPSGNVRFIGWFGSCSGTGDCKVSMTKDKTVTAQFSKIAKTTPITNYQDYCTSNYPGSVYDPETVSCVFHRATPTTTTTYAPGSRLTIIPLAGACCPDEPCSTQIAAAAGGTPPYTFSSGSFGAGGAPPMGMLIDVNGYLTGTAPSAVGTFSLSVCVKDLAGQSDCGVSHVVVS
jgi:hypothetical protein